MSEQKLLYLDNAATSHPKPEEVYRAVDLALRHGGSASRGTHRTSLAADQLVFATRELLAELFHCPDSARFIFTFNATMAINQALFGLLRPGDRVVTSSVEHNAVARPLQALTERDVEVVKVAADPCTGLVAREDLYRACLEQPTRLLVINHCSNVFGTLQNLVGLGSWCHEHGVLLLVDGSQSAGAVPIDLAALEIDLFAAPGHKGLLGPQGTGFLYLREGIELTPLLYGGTGANSHSVHQPAELPERLESGTYNMPGLAGLHAALEFVQRTGISTIRAHEQALVEQLVRGLEQCPGLTIYGSKDFSLRGAAVSFNIDGRDPAEIGYLLDQQQIAVRVGLHCAPDAHRSIGTFPTGSVRVSPGYFTREDDIARFIKAIDGISRCAGSL
ncbi:aminotransferase class V-fold PLP-dependent enzyme [Pelobacter seleniigenes]|uniref:aminotransferase class V-fold PLP-dependent enzyme n=1 Tax=Pelobacter seleniigenes TaxID=407188 RepID=UPI0004A786CD|nr:aminotransferase class V-fold PLP-dependent enzyme [Pelobacter seleniigenes]